MPGRHHNVFYYFRGPSKAADGLQAEEESQHRQIEDNTTKALINVLELGDPTLTESFLKRFVPEASLDGLPDRSYYLQGGPDAPTETTWMLGLSVLGEIDPKAVEAPGRGGSRIDAAVHVPGGSLVVIEVKVVEYLDPYQLARHAKEWKIPPPPLDSSAWPGDGPWRLARWVDVFEWASDADREAKDPVSRFLLEQFREYLQLVGLAPFAGFRDEHFAWLALSADQRSWDLQGEIKAHLRTVWEAILERLKPGEAQILGEIHANQLPLDATVAAAQTNWGQGGVNITIELTPDELQVNVVGWNAPQADVLEEWLAPTGRVRSDRLPEGLELAVFRRRPYNYSQQGAGKKPWWQKETFTLTECRSLAELTGLRLADLKAGWRREPDPAWEKLAYHLRRAWPRSAAVASGPDLVVDLTEAVRSFLPLLARINPPSSQQVVA